MISDLGEVLEEDILFLPARFVFEVEEERVVRAMGEEMRWRKGGRVGREGEGGLGKVYGCWERGDSGRRRERKRRRRGKGKGKRKEEMGRRRVLEGEQEKGVQTEWRFPKPPGIISGRYAWKEKSLIDRFPWIQRGSRASRGS